MKRVFVAASLALAIAACKDETVVLATVAANDAGLPPGDRCTGIGDCPAGSFCAKSDCREPAGTCEPFPAVCGEEERPVCGCDGITYFNDCLRRAAGVSAGREEECGHEAYACGDGPGPSCPEGAVCARLLGFGPGGPPPPCGPGGPGRCWVLPARCPPPSHFDRWNACGVGPTCVDTCNAIRAGVPHVRASSCP